MTTETTAAGSISTDELFFTLSNERRRYVLEVLREQGGEIAMRALVREVAARERGVSENDLTYDQRKSVYVSLRQTHLPKMDSLGIVEFDSNAGTIRLVEGVGEFDFYYEPVRANDVGWGEFYVGLAAVMGLFVGATTADLFPFRLLPQALLPWLVIAPFAIAGAVHTYLTRQRRLDAGFPWQTTGPSDARRNGK